MTTPARLLATLLVGAVAATGCTTFTDDETVARVDGAEFPETALQSAIREFNDDPELVQAQPDQVNQTINRWILAELLRSDLADRGVDVDPVPAGDDLTIEELFNSTDPLISEWQALGPDGDDDLAAVEALYQLGPVGGGIVCAAHVLVDDVETAETVLDRLEAGDDFGDLAIEYSTDTGSAANGGVLPCTTTGAFQSQYIPEFVEAIIDATPGDVIGPVTSQFGVHVITLRPLDDIDPAELEPLAADPQVRFTMLVDTADVWVNPRFGEFDRAIGVTPVG